MRSRLFVSLVAVFVIGSAAPAARGEWLHAIGRYLGVGWSDGYHSRTACPSKCDAFMPGAGPAGVPWWAVPAHGAEPLPHPAAERPTTSGAASPSGSSLFRQPGEGATTTAARAGGGVYSR